MHKTVPKVLMLTFSIVGQHQQHQQKTMHTVLHQGRHLKPGNPIDYVSIVLQLKLNAVLLLESEILLRLVIEALNENELK